MLWCEKWHVAWWAGPQMYDFMLMSARARGLLCMFVPLVYNHNIGAYTQGLLSNILDADNNHDIGEPV